MAYSRIERKIAAKKAAKTRALNQARAEHFHKIFLPRKQRMQVLHTMLLRGYRNGDVSLLWDEARAGYSLKKGAQYGTLVGFRGGDRWLVIPEGYKRAHVFDPALWQVLVK